jgi:serine/threonine-protein kinase
MPSADYTFGKIVERLKLADPRFVDVCLMIQSADKRAGLKPRPLGEIMVEKGFLTPNQVERVLAEQRRQAKASVLGSYQLIKNLGKGTSGTVYRARVQRTGAEVAIKVFDREHYENDQFMHRFKREADVGLELDHPHILKVFTVGESRGYHYMVMELAEGGDLRRRLKKRGKIPERDGLTMLGKIASGLAEAHGKGVVHRDIKPANIMFTKSGEPKLADFGLVKALHGKESIMLTQPGRVLGTPHYISPEQARGVPDIDVRTDFYSLGSTFYHALTGVRPFEGGRSLDIMFKVVHGECQPPRQVNPKLSHASARILQKLMTVDRNYRYSSCATLFVDVQRAMATLERRARSKPQVGRSQDPFKF